MDEEPGPRPDPEATRPYDSPLRPAPPPRERIGPYRIRRTLGVGGMGEVYLAERETPVRLRVALKVIKRGLDTREFLIRFQIERQAMALMDHPAIAKVFDAGETEDGLPYFAMEYVDGHPITHYCDRHRLGTRDRLSLFLQACDGIQHAHQKAVLHRDIKPSNILVTRRDGAPAPKIIDFGVAKAIAQPLTDDSVYTQYGQIIGTPAYMSPEQAEAGGRDVDTRTDVYSLGALLYELLVGVQPFAVGDDAFESVQQMIRSIDPPKPSTRLGTRDETSTASARNRGTTCETLISQLRGDLDWITMKALEKERARRYATPSELAADIRRHLRNEPVSAGPPSAMYRVGKFVRRHRVGVGAAAAVLLTMVAGSSVAVWGMLRARSAEADARRDLATATEVGRFLEEIFEVSDPGEARGNSVTAREILDRGADRILDGLQDQPEVQARMMGTIGRVYRRLGLFDPARPLLERAAAEAGGESGALNDLAALHLDLANHDEAESLLVRALARERTAGTDTPALATTLANLGALAGQRGDFDAAQQRFEEALAMRLRLFGEDDVSVRETRTELASIKLYRGEFADAAALLETALAAAREHEPGSPAVAEALDQLAAAREALDELEASEALYREALDLRVRLYGEDHPEVATTWNNLAVCLSGAGRLEEAEAAHRKALALRRAAFEGTHPDVAQSVSNLASLVRANGRPDEAETLFREALRLRIAGLGPSHPDVANTQNNLAALLQEDGRLEEADSLYSAAARALCESVGPDSPYHAIVLVGLGANRQMARDPAGAEAPLRRGYEIFAATLPADHPRLLLTRWRLGACLQDLGRDDEAEPHLVAAFAQEDAPVERRTDLAERLLRLCETRGDARAEEYREALERLREG